MNITIRIRTNYSLCTSILTICALFIFLYSGSVYGSHYDKLSKKQLNEKHAERLTVYSEWEPKIWIRPSNNPRTFNAVSTPLPKSIKSQIKNSSIFTFLYYDGQSIKYDWKRRDVSEDMPIYGMSMSKSIISYLFGKAYCDGRIDSLTDTIGKYAHLLKGTFYEKVRIIDALNMASGDKNLYRSGKSGPDIWKYYVLPVFNKETVRDAISDLGNPKSTKNVFGYRDANSDVIGSVLLSVASEGLSEFMSINLAEPAGFKYPSYFLADSDGVPLGFAFFGATRTDWLRAAIKIGEDYYADGCIGDYLRSAVKEAVPTYKDKRFDHVRYGKFFWSKSNIIRKFPHLAMKGHGGIRGIIGTDNHSGKVIMIHSIRNDYKEQKLYKSTLNK